ncbi:MAG: winged helix DNA-binding domain-containing protein [Ilumatobacteraceae bacterium]|nr:winged helix DNA-binding domain-containing protein [Ilumatobacteraceae bacterium]
MTREVSAAAARRMAVAAQGLDTSRPSGRIDRRHLRKVFDAVGVIQIDSVNVLVRSQELPLFARLGDHPRSLIPDATADGELFEYWAHEAAHVPVQHHRLFRWKMNEAKKGAMWSGLHELHKTKPRFVRDVLKKVRDEGPLVAGDVKTRTGPKGSWWDWDDGKAALEYLFWTGQLTATRREKDFARVYDIPERHLPLHALDSPTPTAAEARRELLLLAAKSLGVGTAKDLADYYRQKVTAAAPHIAHLVKTGELEQVCVNGWREPAYIHPEARSPRTVSGRALLSPFDSLCWFRPRIERLFDFNYRIEIYTPASKRVYGYYVLPFLLNDRLVARVDLKADRHASRLLVNGVFAEHDVDKKQVASELADELSLLAQWLGLDHVHVGARGDLSSLVKRASRGR